jgi:hypothetical protein
MVSCHFFQKIIAFLPRDEAGEIIPAKQRRITAKASTLFILASVEVKTSGKMENTSREQMSRKQVLC